MSEEERSILVAHYLMRGYTVQRLWQCAPTLLLPTDHEDDDTLITYAESKVS